MHTFLDKGLFRFEIYIFCIIIIIFLVLFESEAMFVDTLKSYLMHFDQRHIIIGSSLRYDNVATHIELQILEANSSF